MKRFPILLALMLLAAPAWATVYYVDATGGEDSNPGTAIDNAWQTVSEVNGSSFAAGDSILFKRGDTWDETLTVPSSGTEGSPIYFGDYGSGVYPKITGGLDENGSTNVNYGAEIITFNDAPGASLSTAYTSNPVMYEGIDNQVEVSIGGTGCTFSKNGGGYTDTADNVVVNDNVTVRVTSSGTLATGLSCVLTMGATSDTYTVTTIGCPYRLVSYNQAVGCYGGSGSIYDRAHAFYEGEGCEGTLNDQEICFTAAVECSGSYVDRWTCALGVTGGIRGLRDYLIGTYGR